jgi:hypothetical protein
MNSATEYSIQLMGFGEGRDDSESVDMRQRGYSDTLYTYHCLIMSSHKPTTPKRWKYNATCPIMYFSLVLSGLFVYLGPSPIEWNIFLILF